MKCPNCGKEAVQEGRDFRCPSCGVFHAVGTSHGVEYARGPSVVGGGEQSGGQSGPVDGSDPRSVASGDGVTDPSQSEPVVASEPAVASTGGEGTKPDQRTTGSVEADSRRHSEGLELDIGFYEWPKE
jgi:hypothetical protein